MSREQRIAFLAIAAVIAIVAIVVLGGSGGDDEETATTATQGATATPAETVPQEASPAEPEPTPEPKPPLLTAGKVRTLEFEEGDRIEFRVRHDGPEHVHVHGYDIFEDLEPGKTATVSFKGDITGIFEVELEDSGTPIAELKVEP